MKDGGREFQVEGNKNKGPRTETSLQSQECLKKKNKKKTCGDEAWQGNGKVLRAWIQINHTF